MAASFDSRFINTTSQSHARNIMEDIMEEDRFENGHGYSGKIGDANGITFDNHKSFYDFESADNYLQDITEKYGPAIGVRVITDDEDGWLFGAVCPS